ncbi:MAG: CPBP family intramembrane glutamic endopeptidase [bacterium]
MPLQDFRLGSKQVFGNKVVTVVELLGALLIILAGLKGYIPLSSTPFLLLYGWLMLWLRGMGWRDMGLRSPVIWSRTILIGVAVGVGWQYFSLYAIEPLIARFTGELPDVSQFRPLIGNTTFFLISLVLSWTLAAFAEEMVFRGYLMNRFADLAGGTRNAWIVSLVVGNVLFGLVHLYQGASGVIAIGLTGLLFGALYLATGRNLWVAIIAHGVNDTLGFALIYLGKYPGL